MDRVTDFGEWIKQAQAWRVGIGFAMLAATAIISLLLAATTTYRVPGRLTALEVSTDALAVTLDKHIIQESMVTERIFCVVAALAEGDGRLINPMDPCRRD